MSKRWWLPWLLAAEVLAVETPKPILCEDFEATWHQDRWQFTNGREFPGAVGAFSRSPEAAHDGTQGGRLDFDFRGGGNYVGASLDLSDAPELSAVELWVKHPSGNQLTFRYWDQTGQCLQTSLPPNAYPAWTLLHIDCAEWTGHWGGANDGKVHGAPTRLALLVERRDGEPSGTLLFDTLTLVPGSAALPRWPLTAASFGADEGWRAGAAAKAVSRLKERVWSWDFSGGGAWVSLTPRDRCLLGAPKSLTLTVKGNPGAHPARLRLRTHFMTFEKTLGVAADVGGGRFAWTTEAPPGPGWRWFGGENDGKIHGPLRLGELFLDAAGTADAGQLELVDLRGVAECSPRRLVTLLAERQGNLLWASLASLNDRPQPAVLRWQYRDWDGRVIDSREARVELPTGGATLDVPAPLWDISGNFLEAEFTLTAEGRDVPPAQAYWVRPLPESTAPPALDPASPFGMGLYLYRYGNAAEMDRAAAMGAQAGVKWSREELQWQRLEPARGQFDFSFYDRVVATAKQHGISVYGLLCYWSPWTKPYTAEGVADYVKFVTAMVTHYKADIHHWEIWNEPNIFFWQGPKDLYAELLKQAYAAVKAADPTALVLGCSTAGIDHSFIKRTVALGAPFDILTIHPYRGTLDDAAFAKDLRAVRDLVQRPVWITEMGWGTHVPHNAIGAGFVPTSERKQASLLARSYLGALFSGAAPNVSWYDFRNDGDDPFDFEANMGIVTRAFQPKPAYRAYATVTAQLAGLRDEGPVDLGTGVVAHRFGDGHDSVVVVWSTQGDRTVELRSGAGVNVTNLMGESQRLPAADDRVHLPLTAGVPVFVRQSPMGK